MTINIADDEVECWGWSTDVLRLLPALRQGSLLRRMRSYYEGDDSADYYFFPGNPRLLNGALVKILYLNCRLTRELVGFAHRDQGFKRRLCVLVRHRSLSV